MQLFSDGEMDPEKLVMQVLIWIVPTVWALMLVWRSRAQVAPWAWMALVLILPVLGAVLAISFVWSARSTFPPRADESSRGGPDGFWTRVRAVLRNG